MNHRPHPCSLYSTYSHLAEVTFQPFDSFFSDTSKSYSRATAGSRRTQIRSCFHWSGQPEIQLWPMCSQSRELESRLQPRQNVPYIAGGRVILCFAGYAYMIFHMGYLFTYDERFGSPSFLQLNHFITAFAQQINQPVRTDKMSGTHDYHSAS